MSKIRRPSLFIPTPKAFVHTVLARIAPGTIKPSWTHALVSATVGLGPSKVVLVYTHPVIERLLAFSIHLAGLSRTITVHTCTWSAVLVFVGMAARVWCCRAQSVLKRCHI
jgi:hypothetical protein